MSDFLTKSELAAELRCSARTIERAVSAGRITPIRIGGVRFHLPSVLQQLQAPTRRKRRAGRIGQPST